MRARVAQTDHISLVRKKKSEPTIPKIHPDRERAHIPQNPKREVLARKASRIINDSGYVSIFAPTNGYIEPNDHGYVSEHRLVMALKLRRPLERNEIVHHKNGVRTDNHEDNLELWIKGHPSGQRVDDLIRFIVDHYPDRVQAALDAIR